MSKIQEQIKEILESNKSPEEKINSLIELKYISKDTKKIEDAIIQIFKEDFNAELAYIDIEAEVENIAYRNEGLKSITDEKVVAKISKEREKFITDLKSKLDKYKETKKIVEAPVEEEIVEETAEAEEIKNQEESLEDLAEAFNNTSSPAKEYPAIKTIGDIDGYDNDKTSSNNFRGYNPGLFPHYYERPEIKNYGLQEEPFQDDFIDKRVAELDKRSEALVAQVNQIKEEHAQLMYLKDRRAKLVKERDAELNQLDMEMARRKNVILRSYEQQLSELYTSVNGKDPYSNNTSISIGL